MNGSRQRLSTEFVADRYRLMAFIRGMVRDSHTAEDIFQEVWIRVSEAVDKGTTIENPAGWCRGVARNLILHYWRTQKRSKIVVDSELLELVEQSFSEQDEFSDLWRARERALKDCMQNLPEKSARALAMKYHSGFSISAVAAQLGSTVAGITKLLSRLRQGLGECVDKKLQVEGV